MIFVIPLLVILLIYLPIVEIWALNTLFPSLNIPTTFSTWLAMIIVTSIFHSGKISYTKKD